MTNRDRRSRASSPVARHRLAPRSPFEGRDWRDWQNGAKTKRMNQLVVQSRRGLQPVTWFAIMDRACFLRSHSQTRLPVGLAAAAHPGRKLVKAADPGWLRASPGLQACMQAASRNAVHVGSILRPWTMSPSISSSTIFALSCWLAACDAAAARPESL